MFKVALWNVGVDRVTKDFIARVDTLVEAEVVTMEKCRKLTGISDLQMYHHEDLEYGLFRGNSQVGSFSILSL